MNSENTKRLLIKQAAKKLFIHYGFAKTNMEDIAKSAKMSKPALYYYYENKAALFKEILEEEASHLLQQIDNRLKKVSDPAMQFELFFQLIHAKLGQLARELDGQPDMVCDHGLHGRQLINQLHSMFNTRLEPILERGRKAGVFAFDDIQLTLKALNEMTQFLSVEWAAAHPAEEGEAIFNRIIKLIQHGLQGEHR